MIIRILYYPEPDSGGGEEKPLPKYKNLTATQRRDWNDMLDKMQADGVAGKKDLDQPDKKTGEAYIEKYQKDNPGTTVSKDLIPHVANEHQQMRSGESFGEMTPEQTRVLRKQLSPGFVGKTILEEGEKMNAAMSRMYYPEFKMGDKSYGTDAESYIKDFSKYTPTEGGAEKKSDLIPQPNYNDTTSRANYLKAWAKKYGDLEGRGDTVLKLNEVPRGGSDTMKNISTKAAKQYGLDPALLYSSAMEEGASGLFKNKSGEDTKHRKPGEPGYEDDFGDKEYPISGGNSFGFQTFNGRFPDLVKKGLLPKDFESKFRNKDAKIEPGKVEAANDFKTVEDAMQAKAAMMKYGQSFVDDYAKEHNIKLTDKAKEYFTLAWFNGGEGAVHKMTQYEKEGYLKDDKFLKEEPKEDEANKGKSNDVYGHTIRRIKMRDALRNENLFE